MRNLVRAVVLAALVALPFAVAAPSASADHDGGGLQVEVPGVVRVCVRIGHPCGS